MGFGRAEIGVNFDAHVGSAPILVPTIHSPCAEVTQPSLTPDSAKPEKSDGIAHAQRSSLVKMLSSIIGRGVDRATHPRRQFVPNADHPNLNTTVTRVTGVNVSNSEGELTDTRNKAKPDNKKKEEPVASARRTPIKGRARRRAIMALTSALVAGGTTGCVSTGSGAGGETFSISIPDSGLSVNVPQLESNFTPLPAAVKGKEGTILAVTNSGLEGTGDTIMYGDQEYDETAGHVTQPFGPINCQGILLYYAPDGKVPASHVWASNAASEYRQGELYRLPDYTLMQTSPRVTRPALTPTYIPPSRGTDVYIFSLQPDSPKGPMLDPTWQKPDIIGGVVVGFERGHKDREIVLTGFSALQGSATDIIAGASGGPVLNKSAQREGNTIQGGEKVYDLRHLSFSDRLELSRLMEQLGIRRIITDRQHPYVGFALMQLTPRQLEQKLIGELAGNTCPTG